MSKAKSSINNSDINDIRIGVYICHCGGNISDYVDVEKVRQSVERINGVYLAKTTMFACADSAQKEIIDDLHKLSQATAPTVAEAN